MLPLYFIVALIIQSSFINADTAATEDLETLRETLQKPDVQDDQKSLPNWFELLILPNNGVFSNSSASMMAQITNSNKTVEEQLTDIKELAKQMSNMLETEMVNLFSDVIKDKENHKNGTRGKRSVETPFDSTKMVMRLLNHIKSNNEYQNIAIEKMMSAQEIAEKFGIEFNPDPEILTDLAVAANEHAQEMTNILKNACTLKNITVDKVEFVPIVDEPKKDSNNYYTYGVRSETEPPFEFLPDVVPHPKPVNHVHYTNSGPYNYPYESRTQSPPHRHHAVPVTPKPSFYDQFYPYTPADYYNPYCSVEPVLIIDVEEPELEPELAAEEIEETITSKMIVKKGDEPGSTTVNHVTSYTMSETSHFKRPEIEQLPQHFQYCFSLM